MLQWFIRFTEFAEFTEFLIHLGKTELALDGKISDSKRFNESTMGSVYKK